ncbi:MAG: 50S ribosomal protein L18Ae [Candidatus Odinarchaeia archaeon]
MPSEVKKFIIEGFFVKAPNKYPFMKEVRGLKKEHALEKIYSEIGSNHKVKRRSIKILSIKEVAE